MKLERTPIFAGVAVSLSVLTLAACSSGGGGGGDNNLCPTAANSDPLFCRQWHLVNTGQVDTAVAGEDINVETVWGTYRGTGQRIAIVDDGLEIGHEDLAGNVIAGASHNYLNLSTDPTGGDHGTSVAGVAAAVGFNDVGVRGVAPAAGLVGYNLLANSSNANEADAMSRDSLVSVSNNSWGPNDGSGLLFDSHALWRGAVDTATTVGRGGKGTAIFWAGGNGGDVRDNSNYDGYANYHKVMAIGALTPNGQKASYSEPGANLLLTAPAGEFCGNSSTTPPTTVTTDRTGDASDSLFDNNGSNPDDLSNANYTQCFNGTSSATPVVSGAAALVLEANPALTWRDLRAVLAKSARKNDVSDADWRANGAGLSVNHKYGFGVVDVQAAVSLAQSWSLLPAQLAAESHSASPGISIPDNAASVSSTIMVSGSAISRLEHVEVTFTSDHPYAGDLEIILTSPAGTPSRLAEVRTCKNGTTNITCGAGYASGWRFGSLRHLDESPNGNWTLSVRDGANIDAGTLQSWQLVLRGH